MIKKLLSRFWPNPLVSSPALWGKVPCRGDFIRYNLAYEQSEALQTWISQARKILSPAHGVSQRKVTQGIPWQSLAIEKQTSDPLAAGQPAQPWCFILPPEGLPFSTDRYLIGVWMDSSDKVGREYPLVLFQTASPRWIRQYFAYHPEHPCEWLFGAARIIANSIYAQESELDRPGSFSDNGIDPVIILQARLSALWSLYAPDWKTFLGKRVSLPGEDRSQDIQDLVGTPHSEDPIRHIEGVRFLPWAEWPDCLTFPNTYSEHGYFWQQNLKGRFVGAVQC